MLAIPYRLLKLDSVKVLMQDENSFVLKKTLNSPTLSKHSYIAKHVFSMVISGEQLLTEHDGQQLRVKAGQIGFIPKGIYTIADFLPENGQFQSYLFFIDDEIVLEFLKMTKEMPAERIEKPFFKTSFTPTIELFIQSIHQIALTENVPSSALLKIKLLELLMLFQHDKSTQHFISYLSNLGKNKTVNFKAFLETHFDKPLKVEDYAYLTGRSLSTFRRDFKRHFNTSPQKWLIDKRMEKAHQLLISKKLSVTNVAFEVGYDNISHFIKAFKSKYELTPKQLILTKEKSLTEMYHS